MNYFKLLYGLDIPHKSLNYKKNIFSYLFLFKKLTHHISISYRSFRHWSIY
jgi:hypothetical protein